MKNQGATLAEAIPFVHRVLEVHTISAQSAGELGSPVLGRRIYEGHYSRSFGSPCGPLLVDRAAFGRPHRKLEVGHQPGKNRRFRDAFPGNDIATPAEALDRSSE
jgi:hypothetical protein